MVHSVKHPDEKVVLDRDALRRTLVRIAHEIVEKNPAGADGGDGTVLAVVGIHTRGAVLAGRLHALVGELCGSPVPLGDLDISFYRDDVGREPGEGPTVHASHLDFDLAGRTVVLVDDVLFTGRTARAAIDALFDYGRPDRVQLAVLADRGHRELPIRPDYVGKNLPTAREERVFVRLEETDGRDEVAIGRVPSEGPSENKFSGGAVQDRAGRRTGVKRIVELCASPRVVIRRSVLGRSQPGSYFSTDPVVPA